MSRVHDKLNRLRGHLAILTKEVEELAKEIGGERESLRQPSKKKELVNSLRKFNK